MEELLASEVSENSRQPQKPTLVRYTTNKATYADLQRTLGENHNGILMDLEDLKKQIRIKVDFSLSVV